MSGFDERVTGGDGFNEGACRKCGAAVAGTAAYCSQCGSSISEDDIESALLSLQAEITRLRGVAEKHTELIDQHADVINSASTSIARVEKRLKSSQVFHERFWPRAWAVFGNGLAPGALIYLGLLVLMAMIFGG